MTGSETVFDTFHFHRKKVKICNQMQNRNSLMSLAAPNYQCKYGKTTQRQARNQNFAKGGLNLKLKYFCPPKMSHLNVLSKPSSVQLSVLQMGTSPWAYFVIFGKNSHFNAIWMTFCTFLEPFGTI